MPNMTWEFYYSASRTEVTDILSVDIRAGRSFITDPYSASTCTIEVRNISSWSGSPPRVGQRCYARGKLGPIAFGGLIKDVRIEYGIIPALDTATIECEGILARLGRRQLNAFALAEKTTGRQVADLLTEINVDYQYQFGDSIASAQTYTGNALDLLNELTLTEVGRIIEIWDDGPGLISLIWDGRNYYGEEGLQFSDETADSATHLKYDQIGFTSAAENYYTQVTIEPQGLASQTESSGSAPYYGLTQSSLDATTTQADNHAAYLLNAFDSPAAALNSLSFTYSQQVPGRLSMFNDCFSASETMWSIGELITVKFRGTTYYAVIEGFSVSADPDDTRVTLNLSSEQVQNYLILNNAVFGTLDENKLGF
jgi:hypothetical protein